MHKPILTAIFLVALSPIVKAESPEGGKQESATGITHSILALGDGPRIIAEDSSITHVYPTDVRDGWKLPNGDFLLAVTKGPKDFPHGGAVEITPAGKVIWQYKGTQDEVNTVEAVNDGHYIVTEAGDKPRLLELDREGKILVDMPIQAQIKDHHLQTRMSRKLPNGDYLVPQLLDKVVREYTPAGKIVWEAKSPEGVKEDWPFTAIRLPNGNTLSTLTHSRIVVEFDKDGKVVWKLTNADLGSELLVDPCGAQRLPNGNTVITSYGQGKPGEVKLLEVTPEKKVVWTYRDNKPHGIHEFQVLTTNGKPVEGTPMK
ncbi:MAG TPA: hypothetical protein VFE47_10140 [Tepidisphaeraceae bacterium]|jgi:hypothetical protein|nr:hypothetical protein [Tepidisphaeraceae bacterium]